MSYVLHRVGELVYFYGQPRRVGVVENVTGRSAVGSKVTVRFPNGERKTDVNQIWQSLDELIADHERKLQNHLERREQARRELGL